MTQYSRLAGSAENDEPNREYLDLFVKAQLRSGGDVHPVVSPNLEKLLGLADHRPAPSAVLPLTTSGFRVKA